MIFAREISDSLTGLVKKIDKATVDNAKAKMGSFVVFCNNDEKMEGELKKLAKKEELKKCILTLVDQKSGPKGYKIHKDADVTVVLYVGRKTKAEYAFKKGEMKDKDVEAILADLSKILPEKK
ncbi:MAG: hypothetical protein K2W96_00435 [Gemmataceae bacterium]|nr:hypothetical protein [Gemmataceae bacterium]